VPVAVERVVEGVGDRRALVDVGVVHPSDHDQRDADVQRRREAERADSLMPSTAMTVRRTTMNTAPRFTVECSPDSDGGRSSGSPR
jgi:hypothetical protein